MNLDNNWLADLFIRQRKLIEAAETPFAKLTVFILPILAPLVPALMTGVHLFRLFSAIFKFENPNTTNIVAFVLSAIPALVLELLGYVGAITAIKSLFIWVNSPTKANAVPMALNGAAYLFYLLAMLVINIFLGQYLGEAGVVTGVIAVLSFITVPTSLIAANHLIEVGLREEEDRQRELRIQDEDREFARQEQIRKDQNEHKLRGKMIKAGMNPLQLYQQTTQGVVERRPEPQAPKTGDWRLLGQKERYEVVHVLSILEIMEKHNVSRPTAYAWKTKPV